MSVENIEKRGVPFIISYLKKAKMLSWVKEDSLIIPVDCAQFLVSRVIGPWRTPNKTQKEEESLSTHNAM
jgi:hypothetical protein